MRKTPRYLVGIASGGAALLFAGCATTSDTTPDATPGATGTNITLTVSNNITVPIEPFPPVSVSGASNDWNSANNCVFPNTDFSLTLEQFDASGNISFVVGSASGQGDRYEEIVDFKKYFTNPIPLNNTNGTTDYAYLQIGMAYRARLDFTLISGSINAGFSGFTGGASGSNIEGNISFSLYGLTNAEAQSTVPMPASITPDKIEEYFQSLAVVKNVVNSPDQNIEPQIIAINPAGHTVNEVLDAYYRAVTNGTARITTNSLGGRMYLFTQ